MSDTTIGITFDLNKLPSYGSSFLAALWHAAQWNPAKHGDYMAGEIASKVGFEIIRRWLAAAPVEMYHHQQRDNYWQALTQLARYEPPADADPTGQDWHNGRWIPKTEAADQ